jgi:hypothetical protein
MDELPPPPAGTEGLPPTPEASSTTATVAPLPSVTEPPRRRWPIVVIVVGALILVLGGIGAVVAASGGSSSNASSPSASVPSPSVAPPSTPTNLRAAAGSFQVKLTWHPGTEGSPVTRYDIRRDGAFVGQAKPSASSFTDTDAVPSQHYKYTVTAVGADQQRAVATVDVSTKGAPPGTAALIGTFNVHLHNTSHSGFSSFANANFNNGWRFQPQCKQPPCTTQLRNINNKKMVISLKQSGGSYTGSTSVAGLVTCQGHDVTTAVTVTIHATQADGVHDTWQITKFAGTMSQSASAQLGCTSSSASFTVTGTSLKR